MVWSRMMMRFWDSASVAVHATLILISQNDDATMVLHVYFIFGCCVILNLPAAFASAQKSFGVRKATVEGPIAQEADKTTGVKMVLFPALFVLLNDAMAAFLSFLRPHCPSPRARSGQVKCTRN